MKRKRGRPRKLTKRDKILKVIKTITLIFVLILCLEIGYLSISNYLKHNHKSSFDGINDFIYYDSNYITVGSNNNNDKMLEKGKVTRYDDKKEKIWEQVYNKSSKSSYLGVTIDNEGNIITVGNCENKKVKTALLVKYDKDGEVLLEKKLKGLDNTTFTSVKYVDNGYIVTGQSVYKDRTIGNGKGGAFILKYDKEGKLLWRSNYGSNKIAVYNDFIVYDEYIYVVGKSSNNDGVIVKYDLNGSLVSDKKFNKIDEYGFTGIVVNDDHLIISGGKVINSLDTDAIIIELDSYLDTINETIYRSSGKERFNKVIIDSHNNIITIGSISTSNKHNQENYDALIGKYDIDLEKTDVIKYDDNKNDYFTQIKLIDGNYVISGYSSYENEGYLSKFITYSDALKVLEVK
ncbi:MAG: hypothetical protein IKG58_00060 [Bacilli bacterium]|nr:hypothetical protein [Bacilli bacterium]MBR3048939.1 hypothetical protein [Bacilli bacterium]